MRRELTNKMSEPGMRMGRWKAMPLGSKIATIGLLIIVLAAIICPMLPSFNATDSGIPVQPPSGEHLFGTDSIGRDIFSRVMLGARYSLVIGIFATLIALLAASVLGSIAATAHKAVSEVLMRLLDIIMSFPGIALAAVFVAVFGRSIPVLVLTIAFLYTPQLTRVVRANVMAQYGEDYVSAAKVAGTPTWWIIVKHVARNCMAPVLTFATVMVADAIVFEASLSFINAGVRPPEPSWGNILSDGKVLLLNGYWWPTFFPGLMILLTVLFLNILSEGMTDAMIKPAARRQVKIADPTELLDAATMAQHASGVEAPVADEVADGPKVEAEPGRAALLADAGIALQADADVFNSNPVGKPHVIVGGTAEQLNERLALLRDAEIERKDRLVYGESAATPLLEVDDLCIRFPKQHGDVNVVDHVSFSVRPGETMGLVGESGCGKSITSLAIMGLLPPEAQIEGSIRFLGDELLTMSPKRRNDLRGHEMSMIYQDALSSLNPSMLIKNQIAQLTKRGGTRSAEELLELVGLDPKRTLGSYPHELSGGQRQRVLIAMGLTRDPKLVIADEPTTALDVTVQKQVVDLLNELREKLGFAMVFVSHDLALVAKLAHRITVMYAGQVVESGPTSELMSDPRHEYTRGLLGAVLSIEAGGGRLHQIPGVVPSPRDFVPGDRFSPRSIHPEIGRNTKAVLTPVSDEHMVAIHKELQEVRND